MRRKQLGILQDTLPFHWKILWKGKNWWRQLPQDKCYHTGVGTEILSLIKLLFMSTPENGWSCELWWTYWSDWWLFIKLIELKYREILNINFLITYSGQDFCDQPCSKITNSELLQRDWDLLTKNLKNTLLCDKLFHRIVTKWVNIRINAFIKTWMQIMRRESEGMNKPGAQGEVSLRKSLH